MQTCKRLSFASFCNCFVQFDCARPKIFLRQLRSPNCPVLAVTATCGIPPPPPGPICRSSMCEHRGNCPIPHSPSTKIFPQSL